MARKYNGGMEVGTGFDVQSNRPLDERDIVQTQIDLLVLENCYPGIEVKVEDESYVAYKWNGIDQTNIANWTIQTSGGGGTGDGDMLKSDYAFDNNTVKDSNQLNGQEASAYMTKTVYDSNGNGIVDNSEQLGGQNPAYYDQGQALTDHVDNTDVHLSTDERAAIDNSPNVPNAGNAFATQADLAAGGNGDMLISVYGGSDANTVRNSDTVDGLTGAEVDQRTHVADVTTNPHAVTKANVNLGNADNTSDLAKPISTATQTALDTKLNGVTAGTGVAIDYIDPLSPTISTTPQTTAGVISRNYFTGDQETTTAGTFYTTSPEKGTVAETIQTVICTNGQTQWYAIDTLGVLAPFDTQLYAGTYAGQISVESDGDKDFNRWTLEVYLCDDQGAPTPSGVTGAPIGDLGVQVLAILDTGLTEFRKDEVTQLSYSGPLLETVQLTTGQRARYHISADNTGTSGETVTYTVYGGFDHMTFIDTPITLSASDIYNDSSAPGSTQKEVNNDLDSRVTANETDISGKAGLADDNTFSALNIFTQGFAAGGNHDATINVLVLNDSGTTTIDTKQTTGDTEIHGTQNVDISSHPDASFSVTANSQDIDTIEASAGSALVTKEWAAASKVLNEPSGSSGGINIVRISQANYDLGTPNANTFYIIE